MIEARKTGKTAAYKAVVDFAYSNIDVLCTPDEATGNVAINLKDLMGLVGDMEDRLKGNDNAEKSPLDVVREWLTA